MSDATEESAGPDERSLPGWGASRPLALLGRIASKATSLMDFNTNPVVTGPLGRVMVCAVSKLADQKVCDYNKAIKAGTYLEKGQAVGVTQFLDKLVKDKILESPEQTGVYGGQVDTWTAIKAFGELSENYDATIQGLKFTTEASGRSHTARGFEGYGLTHARPIPSVSKEATLDLTNKIIGCSTMPNLKKVIKSVIDQMGLGDTDVWSFRRAHCLRYPTVHGSLFGYHSDFNDFKPTDAPHLSICMLLSPCTVAEMLVAGCTEPFPYKGPGHFAAFPSVLYHAAGKTDQRKYLLVIFFRLMTGAAPTGTTAGAASSSSAAAHPAEAGANSDAEEAEAEAEAEALLEVEVQAEVDAAKEAEAKDKEAKDAQAAALATSQAEDAKPVADPAEAEAVAQDAQPEHMPEPEHKTEQVAEAEEAAEVVAEPTVEVMPVALAAAPIEPEPEDTIKAEAEVKTEVATPEGVAVPEVVAEVEVVVKTEAEEPQSPSSRLRHRAPPALKPKADGKSSKRSKPN